MSAEYLGLRFTIRMPGGGTDGDDDIERKLVWPLHKYYVPFRCLVPFKVDNLLVVGRCMFATHQADGWTRDMPVAMVNAQAAGVAAVICSRLDRTPRKVDIDQVRAALRLQNVFLD
jgi:hypothetical protein